MLGKFNVTLLVLSIIGITYGELGNQTRSMPTLGAPLEERNVVKYSTNSNPVGTSKKDITHSGREIGTNVTEETLNHTNDTRTTSTTPKAVHEQDIKLETSKTPGDLTHREREMPKDIEADEKVNNTSDNLAKLNLTRKDPMPTYDVLSEKNDGKSVVPKKGVVYDNFTITLNDTLHENQEMNIKASIPVSKALPHENLTYHSPESERFSLNSKFMLPLIGILFTLPLLGVLFVGVYKKGAEWWQHRHYRRMDFLIDGMYNN